MRLPEPESHPLASPQSVAPSSQGLLGSADVLLLHVTHEMMRLQRLREVLTPNQVIRVQGEWALLAQCMDAVEAECKQAVERAAKAVGLIA